MAFLCAVGTAVVARAKSRAVVNGLRAGALELPVKPRVQEVSPPQLDERGIDGIGNYGGLLLAEANPALFHIEAYGRAGSREWGEWEHRRRTDEAVAKSIDFVIAPLRDSTVTVTAAGESTLQQQQADFVKWNLTEALEPGWAEFLNQSAGGALACGFALHEKVFEACEHELLPSGRGYRLSKLAERLPSSLPVNCWIENPDTGELERIRQTGPRAGKWTTVELDAARVLLHTWQRNGNNYAGYSAYRAVWYAAKIREQLLKLVAVSLVREGAGIPIAYTDDPKAKLTKPQRDSLIKLLQNLVYHENASVVLPSGWKMEWVYSPAANKGHVVDTYNALGLLILEQVGAQQLYLGTGGTGSRSVGEVHQGQSRMFTGGLIRSIEDLFNGVGKRRYTGVCRDLIDYNWGPPADGKYPKLGLEPQEPGLKAVELADALGKGKSAGVFTPTHADENAFRKKVGFAPIDEAERKKAKEEAAALAPPSPFGPPQPQPGEKLPKPVPTSGRALRAAAFVPARALRESEKVLNLTAMASTLDRAPVEFADEVRPLVAEMLMRALPKVKAAMASDDLSAIGNIQLDTKRLENFVGIYLEALRAEGYRQVFEEKQRSRKTLHAAAEEDEKYPPDDDGQAAEDAQAVLVPARKHLVKRMTQRLLSDLERDAIDVDRTDGEPDEVVRRTMGRQTSTNAFNGDAAIVTTKAFNVGRQEFADEYGSQIASAELSSVMDLNTCGPCERLDGEEFDFGSPEEIEHTPPLSNICDGGDRCRCIKVFNFQADAA